MGTFSGVTVFFLLTAAAALEAGQAAGPAPPRTGKQVFLETCAACHGPDGRGQSRSRVGFSVPFPDFTDPDFASREPQADWVGVALNGGPSRGFSEIMPSFGRALSAEEVALAVGYLKTFAQDDRWPPGDFNLPRPLVTGKAYPEDEAVFTLSAGEKLDVFTGKFVYEQRFGPRSMWEVVVPFGWSERTAAPGGGSSTRWGSSLGDVAVAVKSAFYHNLRRGSILSAVAELILPTGDEDRGFGKGTFVLEPFLAFGQILPADFFLQAQAGMELPFRSEKAKSEAFLRLALGKTIQFKPYGRTWSPMVEVLAAKELVAGEGVLLDLVPQLQVSLNKRRHILFNVGLRLPLNETHGRSVTVLAYLLWDWFDGAFFDGW
jgi:mono/diheme cytochrome c family protein